MTMLNEEGLKAANAAVNEEWQTMVAETSPHMSPGDIARSFVAPGNHRLLRAAITAYLEAANQPEKRETGYYWVSDNDILFWNGSAWYHGANIYMDQDVTPISDRLSPPVPNDTWTTSAKHPDANIHPVIYINKNETVVYRVSDVDILRGWCWRYATDWTAPKYGERLPNEPGLVMFDNGKTIKVANISRACRQRMYKDVIAYKVEDA